jgi:hypothetical protein
VVVAFDEDAGSTEDLVESVEGLEEEFGVQQEPFAGDARSHPADAEPIVRGAVEIAGAAFGLGLTTMQRVARPPPIPYVGSVAGRLAFPEHQPRARRVVEHVIGSTPAELTLSLQAASRRVSPVPRSAPSWTWDTGQPWSLRRSHDGSAGSIAKRRHRIIPRDRWRRALAQCD